MLVTTRSQCSELGTATRRDDDNCTVLQFPSQEAEDTLLVVVACTRVRGPVAAINPITSCLPIDGCHRCHMVLLPRPPFVEMPPSSPSSASLVGDGELKREQVFGISYTINVS